MKHTKGSDSAKMKDALYNIPKTIPKILKCPLPTLENIEHSYEEISDKDFGSPR